MIFRLSQDMFVSWRVTLTRLRGIYLFLPCGNPLAHVFEKQTSFWWRRSLKTYTSKGGFEIRDTPSDHINRKEIIDKSI